MVDFLSRARGALVGLAVGDALGTTNEFSRGSFEPISDMVGGGVFDLEPGQWTDDTSMALCLADSLLALNRYDSYDVMERYDRWRKDGYRSSTGTCFDIGNQVMRSLWDFHENPRIPEGAPAPPAQATARSCAWRPSSSPASRSARSARSL